jgi:hypothetical protein
MKVKYGYRPKQNGIPIKHKAMLLFKWEEDCKRENITKNYGAMDLQAILWLGY